MKNSYFRKALEISVLSSVFFLPLVFFPGAADPFWVTEEFMLRMWFLVSSALFALMVFSEGAITRLKAPFLIISVLFLASALAGFFGAYNKAYFWGRMLILASVFGTSYFIVYLSSGEKGALFPSKVILAAVLSASATSAYGILQAAGFDIFSWSNTFAGRAAGTFGNPNFLGGHVLAVIPFAVFAAINENKFAVRLFYIMSALAMAVALLLTQTRSAYLGLFVIFAAFILMGKKLKTGKTPVYAALMIMLAAGLFAVSNEGIRERLTDALMSRDEAGKIRVSLWKNSMYMIKDAPLLGTSAGNFQVKYPFYQSASLDKSFYSQSDYYKSSHAHNDLLQTAAEFGLPAAGFFFLLLVWLVITAARAAGDTQDTFELWQKQTAGAFVCAAAGLLTHAFFNFPFLIAPTFLTFFVLAAAMFSVLYDAEAGSFKHPLLRSAAAGAAAVFLITASFQFMTIAGSAYLRQARQAEYLNNFAAAVDHAENAVKMNPYDDELRVYMSGLYKKTGNAEAALRENEQAYKLNKGSWDASFDLTNIYIAAGKFEQADTYARNCFLISPYSARAITSLGYVLFQQGKPQEAAAVFERGISLWPEQSDMYYQLSASYGALGNNAKALELAKTALEKESPQPGAYFNMAIAYHKSGMASQAREQLMQIKKSFPQHAQQADSLLKAFKNAEKK